jgi:hypothetical protein
MAPVDICSRPAKCEEEEKIKKEGNRFITFYFFSDFVVSLCDFCFLFTAPEYNIWV